MALPTNLIRDLNYEVSRMREDETRRAVSGAGVVAWLTNVGGLISEYLPQILQVLKALAAVSATQPTVAEFFRMGNAMFNEKPADPAKA